MSSDPRLNPDFVDLLRELLAAGVRFVLVGAHAMAVHGVPRATGDLDVFVRPDGANAERVFAALTAFGAPLGAHGVGSPDLSIAGTVYQIGQPPRRVDILTGIDGVSFDEAWSSRVVVVISGLEVPVLGRDALVRNKRATGRERDRLDVELLGG